MSHHVSLGPLSDPTGRAACTSFFGQCFFQIFRHYTRKKKQTHEDISYNQPINDTEKFTKSRTSFLKRGKHKTFTLLLKGRQNFTRNYIV